MDKIKSRNWLESNELALGIMKCLREEMILHKLKTGSNFCTVPEKDLLYLLKLKKYSKNQKDIQLHLSLLKIYGLINIMTRTFGPTYDDSSVSQWKTETHYSLTQFASEFITEL